MKCHSFAIQPLQSKLFKMTYKCVGCYATRQSRWKHQQSYQGQRTTDGVDTHKVKAVRARGELNVAKRKSSAIINCSDMS